MSNDGCVPYPFPLTERRAELLIANSSLLIVPYPSNSGFLNQKRATDGRPLFVPRAYMRKSDIFFFLRPNFPSALAYGKKVWYTYSKPHKFSERKYTAMSDLKSLILAAAEKEGIDLIGFASKARYENVPAQINPFSIFPEGKTVILVGKRVTRGSLRGVEEGTNFGDYNLFGRAWLEDEFLALACYNLVNVFEDNGWEACPIFPNPTELPPQGVSVKPGRPAPNVYPDFNYAAVACGICEIGFAGVPLSPKFGSRQRFHMIITDAEIEESPLLTESVCDRCGLCAQVCPLGAISLDKTEELDICGKKMTVAAVDYEKCRNCKNGACPNRQSSRAKPDRLAALCNRTCLAHLEQGERITNTFELPFRKRPAWAIDGSNKNVEVPDEFLGGVSAKSKA